MCKRGLFTNHRFVLTNDGHIRCEKCWGMWDLEGRELIPYGFQSWGSWQDDCIKRNLTPAYIPETHWSGKNSLTAREVAKVLVEGLITKHRLQDRTEIRALRNEAKQSPDVFIDELLGRNQP